MTLVPCPCCQCEVKKNARHCPFCGAAIKGNAKIRYSYKPRKSKKNIYFGCAAFPISLVAIVVGVVIISHDKMVGGALSTIGALITVAGVIGSIVVIAALLVQYSSKESSNRTFSYDHPVICPHCGSSQIQSMNKGFSAGKAAAGGLLFGPVGLLGGVIGANKAVRVCLNCMKKF